MTNPHGEHIWYELLTDDIDAARHYYCTLHDWRFIDTGQGGYHQIEAKDPDTGERHPVGGALALTAGSC